MTRRPEPDDQAAHQWLTEHQHSLTRALADLLDTEAGLREILLHSHHDAATESLDSVLDAEAGLAAILPATPTPPFDTQVTLDHGTEASELLRTLNPADRMALRNHSDVRTASASLAHDRRFTRDLDEKVAAGLPRTVANIRLVNRRMRLASSLARSIVRDLDFACARALELNRDQAVSLNFINGLSHSCDVARSLLERLDRLRIGDINTLSDPEDVDRSVGVLSMQVTDAIISVGNLYIAPARALFRLGPNHARTLVDDLAHDLDRALARSRDLSHVFSAAMDDEFDTDDGLIVGIRTAEVGRAIGLALSRAHFSLDEESVHAVLDDFTTSDLRAAELTNVDLSGVHWSEHTTRWPPTMDIEDLKTQSDETTSGSGTWIIRSGTATIRDLAER